ncbi:MAG: hypothetical protein PHT69_12505 [Bacteroidales bacterium]|nr:hypothetical protein [Bacteroidales bacterium]
MRKFLFFITVIHLFTSSLLFSQTDEERTFGITFSGFVKNDVFFDTRQTIASREGHFLLFPANIKLDENGKDINAQQNFNMLAIQSRLTGNIKGPDAFGAKTSGVIEGAFFGHTDADINGFRLRHAFVKLNWNKTELLAGQYWHPLFIPQAFPEVISFNTGVPFQPFSRNPQIRLTHKIGPISIAATAFAQRDFSSTGPLGVSNVYMRNAVIPNTNLCVSFAPGNKGHLFGVGADYKIIKPELVTAKNFKNDNTLESLSVTAFSKIKIKNTTWKLQALVAQNAFDLLLMGGYGIKNTNFDTLTGIGEYTNFTTGSVWTELYTTIGKFTAGVFGGFSKNFGTDYNMLPGSTAYARGSNIDYVYRVSPRIVAKHNKTAIALEVEYTVAAYGQANSLGQISNAKEVANLRALLAFIYQF